MREIGIYCRYFIDWYYDCYLLCVYGTFWSVGLQETGKEAEKGRKRQIKADKGR